MGKRLGLIVGINQYQDAQFRPLQYAENDARALAQWLVNVKGGKWTASDVQHVQGNLATQELITTLLGQMCLTITAPDDLIFVYFAGHAFIDDRSGDGYLACANTFAQNPATAIHLPSLAQQIMARSRAAHILIVLDCVQNGTNWNIRRSTPYDFRPLLASTLPALNGQQRNRLFLCSCRATDQLAEVGERGLGSFMYQSIIGLCGPALDPTTGTAPLRQLHTFLTQHLNEQQKPHLYGSEVAPIQLIGEIPSPPNTPPQPGSSNTVSNPFAANADAAPFRSSAPPTATATAAAQPGIRRDTSGINTVALGDQYRQQQYTEKLEMAKQQLQMQNPTAALMHIEQLLQAAPQYQPALTLKTQILGTLGRTQEALASVDQLIQMDSNDALAWSMRAVLLANIGQTQPALTAIQRSLELDPGNAESYTIKNNIMGQKAMIQVRESQGRLPATSSQQENGAGAFLAGLGLQVAGLVLGIAGGILLLFSTHLPAALGLALQSFGIAILCVNAARGTYHYGPLRIIFTIITSVLVGLPVAALLSRSLTTRIFSTINAHESLFTPLLFVILWLALAAVLPFLAALGGIIARLVRKKA